MQIRINPTKYKEAIDRGDSFEEVELDFIEVFMGAVRHAAREKRRIDESSYKLTGLPPSGLDRGLEALFGVNGEPMKVRENVFNQTLFRIWIDSMKLA